MTGRVVVICMCAFLFGGVGLYAASRKQPVSIRRERLVKFIVYLSIAAAVLVAAAAGHWIFTSLIAMIALLGAAELYRAITRIAAGEMLLAVASVAIYLIVAAGAICFSWLAPSTVAVFAYLVVSTFDAFSQVSGQLLGRHPLAPEISAGKTVEGSIGGMLSAEGMALLLRHANEIEVLQTLVVTLFLVAAALTGDLLASYIKRRSNIKDFGAMLPGHGGILDRFDSFLFVSAACVAAGLAERWLMRAIQ